jgi:hypothetical protein
MKTEDPNHAPHEMAISEAELVLLTRDLDQIHLDVALPALRRSVDEWVEANHDDPAADGDVGSGVTGKRTSRRSFLIGTGAAAAGGLVLAACGSSSATPSSTGSRAGNDSSNPAALTGDLKVAALAASLENLGIFAYGAGIKAATAGKLGAVPPAVVTFAQTAMSQHTQHAAAWNAVLTAAGKPKVTETDPALTPTVKKMFSQVTDVTGLAELALTIENIAAQTYQTGVGALSSAKAVAAAASIQPVEMQHAAILNFVLGKYPVPNAFNPTDLARPVSDLG